MIPDVAAVVETPRRRERKWARDPGAAAAAARRPAAVLLPRRARPPGPRCSPAAFHPLGFRPGVPRRRPRVSERPTERRAEGRDEESQEPEGKRGCLGGGWGGGDYVSFSPEGVSFIYLFFKKIGHESHHIDLPEERRKRVGSEGGRREVNLRIPFN